MQAYRYYDFDLDIGAGAGDFYPVRVLDSPAGQARGALTLPFDRRAFAGQLATLEEAMWDPGGDDTLAQAQALGETLFEMLFAGDVRSAYDRSRQDASARSGGLRIVLRVNAAELAPMPWELLRDPRSGEFLCLSRATPVVRYLEVPLGQPEERLEPPVRILAMAASPIDLPPLNVALEQARLEQAIAPWREADKIELRNEN